MDDFQSPAQKNRRRKNIIGAVQTTQAVSDFLYREILFPLILLLWKLYAPVDGYFLFVKFPTLWTSLTIILVFRCLNSEWSKWQIRYLLWYYRVVNEIEMYSSTEIRNEIIGVQCHTLILHSVLQFTKSFFQNKRYQIELNSIFNLS